VAGVPDGAASPSVDVSSVHADVEVTLPWPHYRIQHGESFRQRLTRDRLIQRTVFGSDVEVAANFSGHQSIGRDTHIPPRSLLVRRPGSGSVKYSRATASRTRVALR